MNSGQQPIGSMVPGKDRIYLDPLSLDDELHVSQAGRYHVNSGNGSTRKSFAQLYDAAPFRYTHWVPQHLERFARKLPGSVVENIETLLRNNTLFPLFEVFGGATLTLSADAIPVAQQISNLPKRIVGESGKIHLCLDCLQSDWEEHGYRYIHRSHQIPGIEVCWKHGSRLLSSCPLCGCPFEQTDTPDLVLAPWEPCLCGIFLPEARFWRSEQEASEVELKFAQFTHDLLVRPTQHLSAAVLSATYKRRISELGLTRKTQIDHKAMLAALEEHFGIDSLARIDLAYRTGRNQHWFRLASASDAFDVPLTRHLAVAHFLFRESDLFWKAAATAQAELAAQISSGAPANKVKKEAIDESSAPSPQPDAIQVDYDNNPLSPEKQQIAELLKQYPEWSIDDLWREQPGLMRKFLRKNADGLAWLQEQLSEETASKKGEPGTKTMDQSDVLWAEKFTAAAVAEYLSVKLPTKTTCNYLMRQAGWKGQNKPNSRKYPLASKTLKSLAESQWHYYARRIIWAKLTVGTAATARSSVIIPSGIEHHRGCDLLLYFSEVPSSRPLQSGTIMEILEQYGIAKDWEGLPPSPKYYVPGQAYVPKRNAPHTQPLD